MANTKTFEQLSAEYEKNQDKEATVLCFDSLGRPIPPRGEGGRFKPKSLDNWTVERDSASGKTIMVDGRPAMLKRDDNSSWDKKDGSSFHWRDATKVLKDLQSVNTKASWTQDRARFDFSNRTSPLLVLPISDWHFGSLGSDYALIEEFTDLILNTPDLYIGIAGDMQQMAIKMRGVLEVSDNALSPKMQNRFLESWLSDIESKVLWSTWDNHCFLPGTEVLTKDGWLDFRNLTEDSLLAQFTPNGAIDFSRPLKLWADDYDGMMYDFEVYNHRQVVTGNHHVVRRGDDWKTEAKDIGTLCSNELYLDGMNADQTGIDLSDDWLELLTWVCMDGSTLLNHKDKHNFRVQFKLSRPDKIENLQALLTRMEIPFTIKPATMSSTNKLQPYCIRIYSTWAARIVELTGLGLGKCFPESMRHMNRSQLGVVLEAIKQTDGHLDANLIAWSSTCIRNVDIIQQACVLNGYRCHYRKHTQELAGFKSRQPLYNVYIKTTNVDRATPATIQSFQYTGKVYCATMPQGTLITRYEGKVAFSGNSVERQENAVGFSTYADLFSRKVVHFNGIGHMEIVVGSETYRIATSHKFRGGRTESNSLNGLMKYLRLTAPYMEMAIGGDTHVFGYAQYPEGGEIKTVLNCGTLQTNSGYAKRNCTLTTFPEFPCFMLRHDKHKIIMFPSIEDMMQCNGLRLAE